MEIASSTTYCFLHFSSTQTFITVTLSEPDGRRPVEEVPTDQGSGSWTFVPVPGQPRGTYTFTAAQAGVASVTGRFVVVAASQPTTVPITSAGPPGTVFRVALEGFTGSVSLYLYSWNGMNGSFQTTLPPVDVDANGEGIVDLKSQSDDPVKVG